MDPLHVLSAKYCLRQDARGFIELWALLVALAAATVALLGTVRQKTVERARRLASLTGAAIVACLLLLTGAFGATVFRWCYDSAAPSLGFVPPTTPGKGIDTLICLSSHAVATIDGWIVFVAACLLAAGLAIWGIFRLTRPLHRVLAVTGAAITSFAALADGALLLFGVSWCQSQRLF